MTYHQLIESAQEIDRFNLCVDRGDYFQSMGVNDPYYGDFWNKSPKERELADIPSNGWGRKSLFEYARMKCFERHKGTPCVITARTIFGGMPEGEPDVRHIREVVRKILEENGLADFEFGVTLKFQRPGSNVIRYLVIANARNRCWERFVFAKELSHLITDTFQNEVAHDANAFLTAAENNWTLNIQSAVEEMSDEAVGVYHAIEVLLPWHLRQCEGLCWDGIDNARLQYLAKRFMVPEMVLRHFFADVDEGREQHGHNLGPYSGFSFEANKQVAGEGH